MAVSRAALCLAFLQCPAAHHFRTDPAGSWGRRQRLAAKSSGRCQHRTKHRGVPVDVFTYRASKAHGYTLHSGPPSQQYVSEWEGLIYAERANGAVLRIRMECTGDSLRLSGPQSESDA